MTGMSSRITGRGPLLHEIKEVSENAFELAELITAGGFTVGPPRGATIEEVVEIAKRAGCQDGRGLNRWTGWEEENEGRWIKEPGMNHIRSYYENCSRALPADLAGWLQDHPNQTQLSYGYPLHILTKAN